MMSNIKSAGCASLTQLQRKLLQHRDHMLVDSNILFQKIKQNRFDSSLFHGRSPSVLLGVGYILERLETLFLDKFV